MKNTIVLASLTLALLCMPSCQKEEEFKEETGSGVMYFQATTSAIPFTKTSYSGELFGGYERIDWTEGDVVRIFTSNTSATGNQSWSGNGGAGVMSDYDVRKNSPEEATSIASLVAQTGKKELVWGTGEHRIFGLYPSPSSSSLTANNANGKFTVSNIAYPGGEMSFTGTTPTAQCSSSLVPGENKARNYLIAPPMKFAYMWAAQTVNQPMGLVRLPFRPMFNVVEVKFTRKDILGSSDKMINGARANTFRLKAITLSSQEGYPLGRKPGLWRGEDGRVMVSITPNGSSWSDASSVTTYPDTNEDNYMYSTSYTLPSYGSAIGETEASYNNSDTHNFNKTVYTFRFIIPYNSYGSDTQLRLRFDFEHTSNISNKITQTLSLKDAEGKWIAMQPGDKLLLSPKDAPDPAIEWEYVLEVEHPMYTFEMGDGTTKQQAYRVKSYRYNKSNPAQIEPVRWGTYTNMGNREGGQQDWRHISSYTPDYTRSKAGWMRWSSTSNMSGGPSWQANGVYADAYSTTVTASDPEGYFKDAIANNLHPAGVNNLSNSKNAVDLSLYNLQGEQISRTTANCYVVPAPGWYKIPLVYGNMIKGGNPNNSAESFHVDHRSSSISAPWIKDALGKNLTPELVWQDNNPNCNSCDHAHGVIDATTAFVDANGEFLYFHLPQHSIRPGNNVIGVKLGNDLVWSWHIWVTDQKLGTKDGRYLNTLIGWTPLSLQTETRYQEIFPVRSEHVKVVQLQSSNDEKHPDGKEVEILFYQPGNVNEILFTEREYKFGRGVYYQYGRKDPMFPAQSTGTGDVTQNVYNGSGTLLTGGMGGQMPNQSGSSASIAQSIKEPTKFFTNSTPFVHHIGGYWSENYKTVYDPSPIGYRVLDNFDGAFKSSYGNPDNYHYLIIFNKKTYPGGYVGNQGNWFLPAVGQRSGDNSNLMGTPVNKNYFGDSINAKDAKSSLWAANGKVLRVNIGVTSPNYIGQLTGGQAYDDPWKISGSEADAFPMLCITDN